LALGHIGDALDGLCFVFFCGVTPFAVVRRAMELCVVKKFVFLEQISPFDKLFLQLLHFQTLVRSDRFHLH
jgi:hypothetical protein